jgi:hypothetical protein
MNLKKAGRNRKKNRGKGRKPPLSLALESQARKMPEYGRSPGRRRFS